MKQIITLLALFLTFTNVSFAQENEKSEINSSTTNETSVAKFEFGVNTTSLIRNNLFDQKEIESYPYDFMMNMRIASKAQIRMAFKVKNSKFDNGDDRVTKSNDIGFRFGISTTKKLAEKIIVYFGVDLLFELNNRKTIVGSGLNVFKSGTDRILAGFGPIIGFGYEINKHISVRIESELYYKHGITTSISSNNPGEEVKSKTTNLSFNPPINLLFYVSF